MDPDSEEMRRTLDPLEMYRARDREWTINGGEIADVAGEDISMLIYEGSGALTVHLYFLLPFRTINKVLRGKISCRDYLP